MPAMVKTRYEDDALRVHPIRLRSQVAAVVAGTAPAGPVTDNTHAKLSKGNREFGLRPRGVRISRTVGTAPNTFVTYAFIPLLNAGDLGEAPNAVGSVVRYNGADWVISAHVPESVR